MYLFATRCSPQLAMARYLNTDAPGNAERAGRAYFDRDDWHSAYMGMRREHLGFLANTARVEQELGPNSWAWADITDWNDTSITNAQKVAAMPERMRTFLTGTNAAPVRYQWGMAMDVELATKWLQRAMKYTPTQIASMAPRDQYNAVVEMWNGYANYWKAINVSPQAWGKYRMAWEKVTRGVPSQLILRGPGGVAPRPYAGATWFRADDPALTNTAAETAADRMVDDGPWIAEAVEVINATNAALGNPKPGIGGYGAAPRYGQGKMMQPVGAGSFGQPSSANAPDDWNKTVCQEGVVIGASCFSPMRASHFVWINNNGLMTGGMDPLWHGVTGNIIGTDSQWVASDLPYETPTTYPLGDWRQRARPAQQVFTIGYGRSTGTGAQAGARAVMFNWLTEYHAWISAEDGIRDDATPVVGSGNGGLAERVQIGTGTGGNFRGWVYQPPAKRYVDLLWPLLEYLATVDPREVAWEAMIDVMGKNALASFISGQSVEGVQRSIEAGTAAYREQMYGRQQQGNALVRFVEGVTTMIVGGVLSIAGTPLAGAAVSAGLNALFATVNALEPSGTRSEFLSQAKWDVFGRADAVPSGTNIYGMIERYLIAPSDPQHLPEAQRAIYSAIRLRSQNSSGGIPAPADFVHLETGLDAVPWPVGYEGEAEVRRPAGPGGLLVVNVSPEAVVNAYVTDIMAPTGRPSVEVKAQATPVGTIGTGAILGAALGLVAATMRRPRTNPSSRPARRRRGL